MSYRVFIGAPIVLLCCSLSANAQTTKTALGFDLIPANSMTDVDGTSAPASDALLQELDADTALAEQNPEDLSLPYLDASQTKIIFNAVTPRGVSLVGALIGGPRLAENAESSPTVLGPLMARTSVRRMQQIRDAIASRPAFAEAIHVTELSDDAPSNKVRISIDKFTPDLERLVAANFTADEVSFQLGGVQAKALLGRFDDTSPFRGGAKIARVDTSNPPNAQVFCSAGIPWRINANIHGVFVKGGIVTAGHCAPNDTTSFFWTWGDSRFQPREFMGRVLPGWSNWKQNVGTQKPFGGINEDMGDVSLVIASTVMKDVDVTNKLYRGAGESDPSSNNVVTIDGVFHRELRGGKDGRICFSGYRTGEHCHYRVEKTKVDVAYRDEFGNLEGWARKMVHISRDTKDIRNCSAPGDSGAPVYSYPGAEGDEAKYKTVKVNGVLSGGGFDDKIGKCHVYFTDIHTFDKALIGSAAIR